MTVPATTAVRVERDERCAIVTLDRGDGRNLLDTAVMTRLREVAIELDRDAGLATVILHGAGAFSAGVDVASFAGQEPLGASEMRERLKLGPALCKAWEDLEAFTIAAIERYCVGGAAALATAVDYRVAGKSAFFRLPEVPMGMNMSWQALPRLVAQIGPARTKQYVILGRRVEAATALSWGLCEEVVEDGATLGAARELAREIGRLPPLPVRMTKQAVNARANALNHVSSFMDRDQFLLASQTGDFAEAANAFLEKRPPRFTGR